MVYWPIIYCTVLHCNKLNLKYVIKGHVTKRENANHQLISLTFHSKANTLPHRSTTDTMAKKTSDKRIKKARKKIGRQRANSYLDLLKKYKFKFVLLALFIVAIFITAGRIHSNNDKDAESNINDMQTATPLKLESNNLKYHESDEDNKDNIESSKDSTKNDIHPQVTAQVANQEGFFEKVSDKERENFINFKKDKYEKSNFARDHKNIKYEDLVESYVNPSFANRGFRPDACFVMFVDDKTKLTDITKTVTNIQSTFNYWLNYPWVFISATGDEFATMQTELEPLLANTPYQLETANKTFWEIPEWIDMGKLAQSRHILRTFPNGDSQYYRLLTRYFLGTFALEPFMSKFDWYWNLEPGMELTCDLDFDIFRFMQDDSKILGINGAQKSDQKRDDQLGDLVKGIMEKNKDMLAPDWIKNFVINKDAKEFEYRHYQFVTTNHIANLNFYRSKPYLKFFEIVDKKGGIFHHGWTIDYIQTTASALLTDKDRTKYLDFMGFNGNSYTVCPIDEDIYKINKCTCDPGADDTWGSQTVMDKFADYYKISKPDSWDKHKDIVKF